MTALQRKISLLYTLVLCLSPLLIQYCFIFDFVLFPEFFLILLGGSTLLFPIKIDRKLLIYVFLFFSFTAVGSLYFSYYSEYYILKSGLATQFRLLVYFLFVLFFSANLFDRKYAAICIVVVGVLSSIYGIVQYVFYYYLNIVLPWYLPWLEVKYGARLIAEYESIFQIYGYRYSALFSEPAHFSQYVGLSLLVILLKGKELISSKLLYLSAIFLMLISLLLGGSGTGFVVVLLVFLVYFYDLFKSYNLYNKIFLAIALGFLLITILYTVVGFNYQFSGLNRLLSMSETSTVYVRILRSLEVFQSLDSIDQFWGLGYGSYADYLIYNQLLNNYEASTGTNWSSSLGFLLTGIGVVGVALLLMYYFLLWNRSDVFGRYLIIYLCFYFPFSDLPLSIYFVLITSMSTHYIKGNL
jgi:hypothetical protein